MAYFNNSKRLKHPYCCNKTTSQDFFFFLAPLAFLWYCNVGVFLTFLYGNSPKQFVQIVFLKLLQHFYSSSIVFLKYYTQTVHWTHLFTYSFGLPRQSCPTWWDCLSAKEYLRPTPHWHFLGFQTSQTLIPSFSSAGIFVICLFLHLSLSLSILQSLVYILLITCLISSLPPAVWSPGASSQLSSRIQMSPFSFPTGEAANNLISPCP